MTHRLATNYSRNYCNRTLIVKVIVENVVTCFLGGHGVLYGYSHKQSPIYNVNTEQDKKCRTERSYKTLITAQKLKLH